MCVGPEAYPEKGVHPLFKTPRALKCRPRVEIIFSTLLYIYSSATPKGKTQPFYERTTRNEYLLGAER